MIGNIINRWGCFDKFRDVSTWECFLSYFNWLAQKWVFRFANLDKNTQSLKYIFIVKRMALAPKAKLDLLLGNYYVGYKGLFSKAKTCLTMFTIATV